MSEAIDRHEPRQLPHSCVPIQGSIKVHRLPVFDADGNIVNIISQSGMAIILSQRACPLTDIAFRCDGVVRQERRQAARTLPAHHQ
jgi:CBS-domain-containing membrane protein